MIFKVGNRIRLRKDLTDEYLDKLYISRTSYDHMSLCEDLVIFSITPNVFFSLSDEFYYTIRSGKGGNGMFVTKQCLLPCRLNKLKRILE